MRQEVADVLWKQAEPVVFVGRKEFLDSFKGWDIREVEVGGRLAFVTAQRGPEFHFTSMNTGVLISMRMIREFLRPIIARYGYAITRAPKTDVRQDRFNRKLGFTAIAENEFYRIYRIERVSCP